MEIIDLIRDGLAPDYQVLEEVGSGGSSVVFRAFDSRHERPVAIKVLTPERAGGFRPERFSREIRIAAELDHPSILPLLDSGEAAGLEYFVMPFVEGESLRDRLERERQLPVEEAVQIAVAVARGLDYAHKKGIVHRDIKPENILLRDGAPVIADFGVAKFLEPSESTYQTSAGRVVGTPAYMSPEHAGDDEVDARSDLYSLGCVLYETLVGEPPFTGPTVRAVVAKHMAERPPSATVVRPSVPPAIAEIVERTLEKSPVDRFQGAAELATALETGITGAVGSWRRVRTRKRTVGWLAGAAAGVAALLAVQLFSNPPPSLDPGRVMVFPLATTGQVSGDELGWDAALAIGNALEHTDPLGWWDGRAFLPAEMRGDPSLITVEVAHEIARNQRAGRYILGVIRGTADSTGVTLRLHDSQTDEVLAQETAWGENDAPPHQAALTATLPLLARLVEPGRNVDLSPLTDRALGAVALTVQGDRAYRLSRFGEAFDLYSRAVAEDSLMAIAAARGAAAGLWEQEEASALALASLAVRHDYLLPTRYQHFVRGVDAYLNGQSDSAVVSLQRALEADPKWVEPAAVLGEVQYHLLPDGVEPVADAIQTFERVVAQDPNFTPPLYHLADIAIRAGEVEKAREIVQRLRNAAGVEASIVQEFSLMLRCVEEQGLPTQEWERAASVSINDVLEMALSLASGGAQPECAEQAFMAANAQGGGDVWAAVLGLQSVWLAQGRVSEAADLLKSALAGGLNGVYPLYVFDAAISSDFNEGAAAAEKIARDALGDLYRGANVTDLWLLGAWLADTGDVARAEALVAAIQADSSGNRGSEARRLARALQARVAEARGETDRAIDLYSGLWSTTPLWWNDWGFQTVLAPERIRWARLLLGRQEYESAIEVAGPFDRTAVTYLAYLAPSLVIRLQAATALGRTDLATSYERRLQDLGWQNSMPALAPTGPLLEPTRKEKR